MAKKIGNLGLGGQGLNEGHQAGDHASLKELFLAVRAELDDLRAKYAALLAKIDADSADTSGDSDYAATVGLGAKQFEA